MKRFVLILFVFLCSFEASFAQSSHGIIRRKTRIVTKNKEAKKGNSDNTRLLGQRVITNPKIAKKSTKDVNIISVDVSGNGLFIEMQLSHYGGYRYAYNISFDKDMYIKTNDKYYTIYDIIGFRLGPSNYLNDANRYKKFTLIFPPIPLSTSSIDLITHDGWEFYGIQLK